MSTHEKSTGIEKKQWPLGRKLAALGTAAVVGGFSGAGAAVWVQGREGVPTAETGLSVADVQYAEQLAESARSVARIYEDAINKSISDSRAGLPVNVLRGVVTYDKDAIKNGTPPQFKELRDPFVLSWNNTQQAFPGDDADLDGGWLGMQTNAPDGTVDVIPIPFSQENMHFQPANTPAVFDSPVVVAKPIKGGPGLSVYAAVEVPPPGEAIDVADRPGLVIPG